MAEQSPVGNDVKMRLRRGFGSQRRLRRILYSKYVLKVEAAGQFDGGSDEKLAKSTVLRYTIS